ncbi:MAG: hypothetical protein AAGD47_00115 [Pseudomonadota bacterium]
MTSSDENATELPHVPALIQSEAAELSTLLGEAGLTCAIDIEALADRLINQGVSR